jgi:hypothetical protein
MIPYAAAWTGHTEESRELAQLVTAAIDTAFLKRESAAALMGLHPADLSRQLSGRDPLNLWRLSSLGPVFWTALCVGLMARMGGVVLTADQLTFIKGFAQMPRKMARMVLAKVSQERRSA